MPLDGVWYNELGSQMQLNVAADGTITGSYKTAVSESSCTQGSYTIAGRTKPAGGDVANVGWVVSWENDQSSCDSVTAWSGEFQMIGNGAAQYETIKTTWLLTLETDQKDQWKSTLVGQDIFTRDAPRADQLKVARATKRYSHPAPSNPK